MIDPADRPDTEPADAAVAAQEMNALYARLAALLSAPDATGRAALADDVLAARGELALACARAGRAEDSLIQVQELVKDCRRNFGEDAPQTARALAVKDAAWAIIGESLRE
ncbi:hypothetical protein Bequi_03545 [Brachybacterium sp. JHP9]|uniref:Uncharacterized protein n=1 Tax=Brachybacterium equifaecis TaxID=2910770 RepID=A0ABT0QXS7_9MICO|nr:hypothetical protein [Brachybacterium equifaecis]MCL6422466.1 hypothetical protein [Brachybacterium equifaecis]